MIKPHGATKLRPLYVACDEQRRSLESEAQGLPSLKISSASAANAVMLGAGYFTPLSGFMDQRDLASIAATMHTADGLFWPVPVINLVQQCNYRAGDRIALRDPNIDGNPVLAVLDIAAVEELSDKDLELATRSIYGTLDTNHPGVKVFSSQGRVLVSGPIMVLNYSYFAYAYPATFRTAEQIRADISERGWNRVVAFQTRNPMHRAHEELCKMAQATVDADGILIHMLLGQLKPGDIPADVRDAAIRTMVDLYFPANSVIVAGYGFDMLYAGPREAVLHAVFRQNAGCTHLIVGRDHAGVGDYYGAFDAQTIFGDQVPDGALDIQIFEADHTAYSRKLDRVVMMRDVPDHEPQDFVLLSGTRVREMLSAGEALPPEFARPEVAQILMQHYQGRQAGS